MATMSRVTLEMSLDGIQWEVLKHGGAVDGADELLIHGNGK